MKIRLALISCLAATLAVSAAGADEPEGVLLLRPDSMVGWEYGTASPAGWKIADGRLTGQAKATPLVSGFVAPVCFAVSCPGAPGTAAARRPAKNDSESGTWHRDQS